MIKFVIAIAFVATVQSQSVRTPAWQVKIGKTIENGYFEAYCRGTIISQRWIVTSARCLIDDYGEWRYPSIETGGNKGQWLNYYRCANISVHDQFNFESKIFTDVNKLPKIPIIIPVNDIALVRVTKPIKFHAKCKSVPIYEEDAKTLEGKTADVSGLVLHTLNQPTEVSTVPINNENSCRNYIAQYFRSPFDIPGQICTAGSSNQSNCGKFKGASLVFNGSLVGIASWHHGRCDNHKPIFYTEVAKYKSWIEETINHNA